MKTKVFEQVVTELFGPKMEYPKMKRVTRTLDIWQMGTLQRHAAEAWLVAQQSKEQAWAAYNFACHSEQKAYANLSELETELEAMEKEAGLKEASRYYTLEVESEDDGEEHA